MVGTGMADRVVRLNNQSGGGMTLAKHNKTTVNKCRACGDNYTKSRYCKACQESGHVRACCECTRYTANAAGVCVACLDREEARKEVA